MEFIIVFLLMLIAVAMFLGKPLKLELHHTYETKQNVLPDGSVVQDDLDKQPDANKGVVSVDDFIADMNKYMGVDIDDDNANR